MSNHLLNFDGSQQNTQIHKAIAEALDNFEPSLQSQSSNNPDSHDNRNNTHHSYDQVPIDPSISEAQHEQEERDDQHHQRGLDANDASKATDVATQELAQAAVQQSNAKLKRSIQQRPTEQKHKVTKPRVNKPGQRFGAKKKSWVWQWFTQDPLDHNVATCEFCGKVIKRLSSDKGSPKKLGEHLKTHKIDKDAVNNKRDNFQNTLGPDPTPSGSHSANNGTDSTRYFSTINTTQQHFKDHQLSEEQVTDVVGPVHESGNYKGNDGQLEESSYSQAKFQKDLMKFLVENKLPLSIVKSSSFKQIIYTLRPEAVNALSELNHLYTSLVDVLAAGKDHIQDNGNDDQNVEVQVEDDDALEPSTSWV